MKKFLITGADFKNKGGQSMLFITIDELRKRFPDCLIYFPAEKKVEDNFNVEYVFYHYYSLLYMNNGFQKIEAIIKSTVKRILGKSSISISQIKELSVLLPTMDAIIDISGYNLSSKWGYKTNNKFLSFIELARKYNVPSFIMPQSFGPFEYKENSSDIINRIKDVMSYPKVVYARENDGLIQLKEKYDLKNVKYSTDIVLQNTGIEISNIYSKKIEFNVPKITTKNNVAIIPNMQGFKHGDKEEILKNYKIIIDELLGMDKTVYVFRHSKEDIVACKWIKELFLKNKDVVLIENDFSCLEYDEFVLNFEFIIASRFHSIVHALREHIPAIALGWAVKYDELMGLFNMKKYVHNITENINIASIVSDIHEIDDNKLEISKKIEIELKQIQANNCYDIISEFLN